MNLIRSSLIFFRAPTTMTSTTPKQKHTKIFGLEATKMATKYLLRMLESYAGMFSWTIDRIPLATLWLTGMKLR